MGEEIPGVTVCAVVLAHGSPLSFTEVRPPLLPCHGPRAGFLEPMLFVGRHKSLCSSTGRPVHQGPIAVRPAAADGCGCRGADASPMLRVAPRIPREHLRDLVVDDRGEFLGL